MLDRSLWNTEVPSEPSRGSLRGERAALTVVILDVAMDMIKNATRLYVCVQVLGLCLGR
jgi:hypothetical protein